MRSSLKIQKSQIFCRAYVIEGSSVIHVASWWADVCYHTDDAAEAEKYMRHELAHIICDRVEKVRDVFSIPDYPSDLEMIFRGIVSKLRGRHRSTIHPEEDLAYRVGDLDPRTMRKLAKALR